MIVPDNAQNPQVGDIVSGDQYEEYKLPIPGDVRSGPDGFEYEYINGDPYDKNNWERLPPTPGDVRSGPGGLEYRFIGGDQYDQNNWSPLEDGSGGFLSKVSSHIEARLQEVAEAQAAEDRGEQNFHRTTYQTLGSAFGLGWDIMGEGIVSLAKTISDVYPDEPEEIIRNAGTGVIERILKSPLTGLPQSPTYVDMLAEADKSLTELEKNDPAMARDLKATGNIALALIPGPKSKPYKPKGVLGRSGSFIDDAARKQAEGNKAEFALQLVRPRRFKDVRIAEVSRTEVKKIGPLSSSKVIPSESEREMAKLVRAIPEVRFRNSLQENYNHIRDRVTASVLDLKTSLAGHKARIRSSELQMRLDALKLKLRESPVLVGDAEKAAERILAQAYKLIEKAEKRGQLTPGQLLQIRKDLDIWLKAHKPKIFDAKAENAQTAAVREIRALLNRTLADAVPGKKVQKKLYEQSMLLRAMDNVGAKAAEEASNTALRVWQGFLKLLPVRGEFNQSMAALMGVGGLGASAAFAPIFTKGVFGVFGAWGIYKLLASPSSKKLLAKVLLGIDEVILKTTDPTTLAQLRADRAAILELIELKAEDLE
jgi:hypothetical protein